MSLDLNKLANKLDEALIKETTETLTKFLTDKRMSNNKQSSVDAYCNGCNAFICDELVTFEETCSNCGTQIEYFEDKMSNNKLSSVSQLIAEIQRRVAIIQSEPQTMARELMIDNLSVDLGQYEAMHKEEIENALIDGAINERVIEYRIPHYYNETFEDESNT